MDLYCARCKRRLKEGRYVYSRFTKNRYCIDVVECGKRAKTRRRPRAAA
jgi:hypothetical protein